MLKLSNCFQTLRHQLLNTKRSPCVSSENYNFGKCIERKIASLAGCRPKWIKYLETNSPVCKNQSQNMNYFIQMDYIYSLDKIQLRNESGCLRPCSFMEYKVGRQKSI